MLRCFVGPDDGKLAESLARVDDTTEGNWEMPSAPVTSAISHQNVMKQCRAMGKIWGTIARITALRVQCDRRTSRHQTRYKARTYATNAT
jgi:hypothetical protein